MSADNIDAFVHDEVSLKNIIKAGYPGTLQVLPDTSRHYYICMALPPGCGDTPSCDCLAGEPCADFDCSELPGGGFVLTCPGG